MNKTVLILIAVVGVCAGRRLRQQEAAADGNSDQYRGAGRSIADRGCRCLEGVGAAGDATGAGVAGPAGAQLQNRTIYFDFDSSEIKSDYNALIAAHAQISGVQPDAFACGWRAIPMSAARANTTSASASAVPRRCAGR